ncbi:hypothetical protein D8674_027506 [Pyrus ussuriensis x Pyrus communis]|uniref:Uncharacterized protein n=1 Tax=Pyrus ussuriensis x Pyrus communis TaxID=2448454 RepID=A0A5N5IER5_9ROSA|nr:hypothetical protein D8674_027506 [Pyrus ussuriensis x Pyrus communis]
MQAKQQETRGHGSRMVDRRPGDPRPLLIDVSDVDGSLVSSFAEDTMFSISGPFIALCSAHVSDLAHRAQTRTYCQSSYLDPADSPKLVISPPLLALGVCNSGLHVNRDRDDEVTLAGPASDRRGESVSRGSQHRIL